MNCLILSGVRGETFRWTLEPARKPEQLPGQKTWAVDQTPEHLWNLHKRSLASWQAIQRETRFETKCKTGHRRNSCSTCKIILLKCECIMLISGNFCLGVQIRNRWQHRMQLWEDHCESQFVIAMSAHSWHSLKAIFKIDLEAVQLH